MSFFLLNKNFLKVLTLVSIFGGVMMAQALTISPARIELSGDPGTTISNKFLLINEQDNEQTFYTSVENFQAQGESGIPSFTSSKEGLSSWVTITNQVTLKKGEHIEIPFTVHIPKDADAGGHFAAIFLSTVPPSTKAGEVAVGAKIGMLMLLRVSGDIKEDGGVLSFLIKEGGHFRTSLPVNFIYRFSNNGNDRANPTGTVSVRNIIGLQTQSLNANPSSGNVLPNSIRRFEVTWGNEPALSDTASFFDNVMYEARNFAFGPYLASLHVTFGTSGVSDKMLLVFVFPWHLLIVVAIILGILYLLLRRGVKRYNKFIISQARLATKG